MTVQLATSSWRAQWETSKVGPLAAQPVRISLGLPKFWPAAAAFPYVAELAPAGLLQIEDDAEFERRYRTRLDRIGVETLRHRFEQIEPTVGVRRLCLLCFEDLSAGEDCHRRTFAAWWQERTSETVPEVGKLAKTTLAGAAQEMPANRALSGPDFGATSPREAQR